MSFQHPYACPQHQTGKKLDIIYTGSQTDDPRTGSVQKIAHFSPLLADHNNTMNRTVSPMEGSPLPACGEREERDFYTVWSCFWVSQKNTTAGTKAGRLMLLLVVL